MKTGCQIIFLVLQCIGFLAMLKQDIDGCPAKQPSGFAGVVGTILTMAVITTILYFAGTFSFINGE